MENKSETWALMTRRVDRVQTKPACTCCFRDYECIMFLYQCGMLLSASIALGLLKHTVLYCTVPEHMKISYICVIGFAVFEKKVT